MSNENVAVIRCPVKHFRILQAILAAYQDAERVSVIALDEIEFTDDTVTIIGQNVTSMMFQVAILGYEAKCGPKKTHLFINIGDKR